MLILAVMDVGWIVALCSGAATLSAALTGVATAWWNNKRLAKQDEVTTLHTYITELRADRDSVRKDITDLHKECEEQRKEYEAQAKAYQSEIKELKDKYTASLVNEERLRNRVAHLEEKLGVKHEDPSRGQQLGTPPGSDQGSAG